MRKLLFVILLLIAVALSAFFFLNHFYPESAAKLRQQLPFLSEQTESRISGLELATTINVNLDSNLSAVLKNERTGQGVAVFSDINQGTESITHVVTKGPGEDVALIKVNDRARPTSLEYRGYLVLFDDYTKDAVHLTIRKPNREYETAEDVSLHGIQTRRPTLGQSRWDILQKNDDSEYRVYLLETVSAILDTVGCTVMQPSLLPTPNEDDSMAFVGCKTVSFSPETDSTVIEPCDEELRTCGADAITHLETIKESNSLDAQTQDEEEETDETEDVDEISAELDEPLIEAEEQEEVFDLMSKIDAVGTLVAGFRQRTENEQGLTEEDEGVVSVSFAGDQGACKMAARSTTAGTPKTPEGSPKGTVLPPVSIVNTTTSTVCTGMLNEETGQFELEGMMATNTRAETGRLEGVETSGVGAFHILGLLQDGTITGTIFYANKAIDLRPQ